MTYILIDNTNDINTAKMTPLIIDYFKKKAIPITIISSNDNLPNTDNIKGIILSGGPNRLTNKIKLEEVITNINALIRYPRVPFLGICFGFQIIALTYGGAIGELKNKKRGVTERIKLNNIDSVLYKNINDSNIPVYQYHNDYISKVPSDFKITSVNEENIPQSIENRHLLRFGTQYHPEASEQGDIILENFITFCEKKE